MRKVLKRTQSHQLLARKHVGSGEINVADDSELDLDALEELIENIGEEFGERRHSLRS